MNGDMFSYRYDDGNFGLDGFDDGFGCELGRDKYCADVRVDLVHGLGGVNAPFVLIRLEFGVMRTSLTVPNTGKSRCVWPPLPGDTPPTTFVPYSIVSLAFDVA